MAFASSGFACRTSMLAGCAIRFSRTDVKKICHDLSILHVGTGLHGLIIWPGFFKPLEHEPRVKQEVEPLADRAGKLRYPESPKPVPDRGRHRAKDPLGNLALQLPKVASDFNRVSQPFPVTQVPSMRCRETRM